MTGAAARPSPDATAVRVVRPTASPVTAPLVGPALIADVAARPHQRQTLATSVAPGWRGMRAC